MNGDLRDTSGFLHAILDAFPAIALVVDEDVRILYANTAAAQLVDNDRVRLHHKRGGEVLACIHRQDSSEGCGRGPACTGCILRQSVQTAMSGTAVSRRKAFMEQSDSHGTREFPLLVTAARFVFEGRTLCLLILEDIGEIIRLREFIPICANCKKIRDDDNYWHSVESYIESHVIDMRFSHSLCPACAATLYPGIR